MRADTALIDDVYCLVEINARPNAAQNVDEVLFILPKHVIKRNAHHGHVLQNARAEGKGGFVAQLFQNSPIIITHHRGQLHEVPDHDNLYATKGGL